MKKRRKKAKRTNRRANPPQLARSIPTLETPRLLLRPLELADAAQIQILFPHWEIVRYLRNAIPWPYPADGALQYVRDMALPATARCEIRAGARGTRKIELP